ncbi:MAG: MFS transporter [Halieaceae bacterium]|jgi:MFS family permease|nr:MFS transporter [Halieaceae bacterium]
MDETQTTVFDEWRSIVISLYMGLVGYSVLVGIPVISTAWVGLLGFSETEVGRVAGADLGGLSLGAVLASRVIAKVNRRLLVLLGIALAVLGNGLCMILVDYESVLWLRLLAGVGSGIYTAVAVATLGATSKPARAFNMLLFAFAFTQALELQFLPSLSMNGIYTVFIVIYLVTLPGLRWLPPHPVRPALELTLDVETPDHQHHLEHFPVPAWAPWLVLFAVLATYINIGAYWTYIELASLDSAASPDAISKILVWASFCSILGCLVATVISNRFGLAKPLLITLVCQALIVGMLASGITDLRALVSIFGFNFLWIFIDVYQMGTIANIDPSGRFAALIPASQGLGQILGPNLAASIVAMGQGYGPVFIMCAAASAVAFAVYGLMYIGLRREIPALADAT